MDFNLPEELQLLKGTVRKFVDRELIPLERECRPEGEDMPEQYIKPLQEKAKAIGLWLLDVPQEYGGAGLDLMSRCVIMEEVARTDKTGLALLRDAADAMHLSARGYHRVLRVARTLADLDGADKVGRVHLAEALSYRALSDEMRRAA